MAHSQVITLSHLLCITNGIQEFATRFEYVRHMDIETFIVWAKGQTRKDHESFRRRFMADSIAYTCQPIQMAMDELDQARMLLFDYLYMPGLLPNENSSTTEDEAFSLDCLKTQNDVVLGLMGKNGHVCAASKTPKDMIQRSTDDTLCVHERLEQFRVCASDEKLNVIQGVFTLLNDKSSYEAVHDLRFREHMLFLRACFSLHYIEVAKVLITQLDDWVNGTEDALKSSRASVVSTQG